MSRVFFISDLHFGHTKIMDFAGDYRHGDSYIENMQIIIDMWNSRVTKRDTVYVLGDVAFNDDGLNGLRELNGLKYLVRGNHDRYRAKNYLKIFQDIYGVRMYKGFWLSHAPIHPDELRGRRNIHGHVHQNSITHSVEDHHGFANNELDERYINVCVETTDGAPVLFTDIVEGEHNGEAKRT
jgi:calcineurin-like phosphoesterase family protein